jgi:signal peptidase I
MSLLANPPVADDDEEDSGRSYTREIWVLVVVAVALALVMKAILIQAFFIPSGSMEKTLHGCDGCKGDRVLVNKVVYKFRDIHRGEIVVFNGKGTTFTSESQIVPPKNAVQKVLQKVQSYVGFGAPGDKDFIKRVIGVEGDVVACCSNGHVTVNGHEMAEPYTYLTLEDGTIIPAAQSDHPQMSFDPVTVPKGQLFLMGDHRDGSQDSRFNGPVPASKVVGRAFAVFYPPSRAKALRVPAAFHPQALGETGSLPVSPAAPPVLGLVGAIPITLAQRRWRRRVRRTTD